MVHAVSNAEVLTQKHYLLRLRFHSIAEQEKILHRSRNKGKFFTGHKFTNLLKSVSWGKFCIFSLLDSWKMAFLHLKGKLTLLEKNIKMKLTLL